jgi:hypothetical protein
MLVTCQRFGDLFLFGLVWQFSSNHKTYNKGRFKVIATSHCLDLDLNGKRPGVTSDGNFSSYLIGRS